MNYNEHLRQKTKETGCIVCFGMDPVLERIPLKGYGLEDTLFIFFSKILDGIRERDIAVASLKPNLAYYEQYGIQGLKALEKIVGHAHKLGFSVIGDGKRGDIKTSSTAYAKALYGEQQFDAVTLSPYMGSDSMLPFIQHTTDRGEYIICRTSNPGAADLQNLLVGGIPFYVKVAEKIVEWAKPGTGAVVGATAPEELEQLSKYFVESGKEIPLLIPGVGVQGAKAEDVVRILTETGNDLALHRINSSSGISYAYEKEGTDDYVGAACRAIEKLNKEIGPLS